jgi:acyl-CoA synthetase (AMP-forming)/AMP-acid ligase II
MIRDPMIHDRMILGDLLERNARHYADRLAVIFENRRITHAELLERVYRLSNALIARGVRRQDRIAILARNCNEYMEVFGAAELAGFIVVNLNYRLSVAELTVICRDSAPSVLVYSDAFADQAQALAERLDSVQLLVGIDSPPPAPRDVPTAFYPEMLAEAPPTRPTLRAEPDDLVYIVYTSGSTGKPKGACYTHAAWMAGVRMSSHECAALPDDIMLIVMPMFHIGGKIEHMSFSWFGATIMLHAVFDEGALLRSIREERVTAAHLAPVMVQRLLDFPGFDKADVATLRCIQYASAPMPLPLLRRALDAFGPILSQVYGMTECLVATILKPHQHRPDGDARDLRRLKSAGQPMLGLELRVVDEQGRECAPGEIGEIVIRSPATMRGYWNNNTATVEALRDGWYHTQDLAMTDADNFVYVVDRKKDMVISGGENIYSWEVEEALRTHQAVAEVSVIGVPDAQWGESVKACVVLRAGATATEEDLIAHCRAAIASYKKPRSVDFLKELPRLFNGKVDKKALRAPYWAGRDRQVA